jgi:hypothetical protein
MADVFINYARQDSDFAQELAAGLKSRGLSVSSDLDLKVGDLFVEAIQNAMASAGCVLTVWSRHSVDSSWVQAEAQWAMKQGKLLPVSIDEVAIPPAFLVIQTTFLRVSERDWLDRLTEDVRRVAQRSDARAQPSEPVPSKRPDKASSVLQPDTVGVQKKAFVSYADEDEEIAIDLVQHLEASGCPCWISFRDVDPGDDYRRSITKAMDEVVFLVLIYSRHVNTSFDIATELILARKRGRKRFVLRLDATEPDGPVEYELATVQWIDCTSDRKAGFERVGRRAAMF